MAKNYAQSWCDEIIKHLVHAGIDHFFIAPGSRNTPLISAVVRNQQSFIYQSIDERSLAFMALGYAKASKKPGVIIVTSGTAVANLFPAVVEAFMSNVPMLILSADRPPELHYRGSNQTIEQHFIFSNFVRKFFNLAPPDPKVSINMTLSLLNRAIKLSSFSPCGPVHLNVQLREPLNNVSDGQTWIKFEPKKQKPIKTKATISFSEDFKIFFGPKTLLVVGELPKSQVQEKILALAEKLKIFIYADISSNLRFKKHPLILHHFDLMLLNKEIKSHLAFDSVIHFGDRVVSKRYWQWLEEGQITNLVRFSCNDNLIDNSGLMEQVNVCDIEIFLDEVLRNLKNNSEPFFKYDELNQELSIKLFDYLENNNNEAYLAAKIISMAPVNFKLFISSSMPIRDMDQFAKASEQEIEVFVNRGASGIDGIISSAVGVSLTSNKATVLLIGDIAFLHDSNSLMLLKQIKSPLLIIVVNNNGGGIFHLLPIANEPEIISPFIDTPHEVELAHLCKAHKIEHKKVSIKNFQQAYSEFFCQKENLVLEVMVEREKNVAWHKEVYQAISSRPIKTNL